MKDFLVDVSLAKKLNMQLPDDVLTTAKIIASAYFGENGSIDQTARSVLRANDQILSDRFAMNTGRIIMYQALNEKFGTNIDFSFVSTNEGGQLLKGYIPSRGGVPIDRSGVTVATGFDIGAHTSAELSALGLSDGLQQKLLSYVATGPGRPLSGAAAVETLASNPLVLTRADAMELDFASKSNTVMKMLSNWAANDPSQPFTALSGAQQTVLTDRSFHFGARLDRTAASDFYDKALAGDWKAAAQVLPQMSNYQTYRIRIDQNVKLLKGGQ